MCLGKSERPVLGVDLDNVIALTDPLIRNLIREMFGVRLEQQDIVHFDYWRCGITRQQDKKVFTRFHKSDCRNILVISEAVNILRYLRQLFEIHVVTARPLDAERLTVDWLEEHQIPLDRLWFCKDKAKIQVTFAAFIDDHRETAYEMANLGIYSLLLDYPWNQPITSDPPNIVRVEGWEHIKRCLDTLAF